MDVPASLDRFVHATRLDSLTIHGRPRARSLRWWPLVALAALAAGYALYVAGSHSHWDWRVGLVGAALFYFAFGTAPNPGGGLQYVQVTPDHWWDGDMKSPTYNTMQVCKKAQCPFNTDPASGTENLNITAYKHAVVMGVNKARVPGNGGAFFVHTTDGGPTAGCVAIDDATLVKIMQWLRPGAVIAVAK